MKPPYLIVCVLIMMSLSPAYVQAHHAFSSSFDVKRPVDISGIVTRVELINPHSWIHLDVANENGETESWRIEGGSPNALYRLGINKNSIPVGSEIQVTGYQARDGSLRAVGRAMTFADGTPVFFGGTKLPE